MALVPFPASEIYIDEHVTRSRFLLFFQRTVQLNSYGQGVFQQDPGNDTASLQVPKSRAKRSIINYRFFIQGRATNTVSGALVFVPLKANMLLFNGSFPNVKPIVINGTPYNEFIYPDGTQRFISGPINSMQIQNCWDLNDLNIEALQPNAAWNFSLAANGLIISLGVSLEIMCYAK